MNSVFATALSGFIDFVPKHPVTRPIQNPRELVVAHSAESSRTAPLRKPALLLRLYEFLLRAQRIIDVNTQLGFKFVLRNEPWQKYLQDRPDLTPTVSPPPQKN